MSSIFLAHSSRDKPFARRLAGDLQQRGVRVWLDEAEIRVGDSLIEKLESAISESRYLGVILSPTSVKSQWVKKEVEAALTQEVQSRSVKVIPILHKYCDVPVFLAGKLWADFTSTSKYQKGLQDLLRRFELNQAFGMDFVRPWTPKATRIGLSCGLLSEQGNDLLFSDRLLKKFCEEAKEWTIGKFPDWQDFMVVAMATATFRGGVEKIPLHEEEFGYFSSEASLHVFQYFLDMGVRCGVLYVGANTVGVAKSVNEELLDAVDTQRDEELREFFIRLFVEMTRARLILTEAEKSEFAYVLGKLAFSLWSGKGYIDDLEGLSGNDRTDTSGVTHPGGIIQEP